MRESFRNHSSATQSPQPLPRAGTDLTAEQINWIREDLLRRLTGFDLQPGEELAGLVTSHLDHAISLAQRLQLFCLLRQNLLVVFWRVTPATLQSEESNFLSFRVNQLSFSTACLQFLQLRRDGYLLYARSATREHLSG